jgi:uncharacterized damage-inducible protein DinB
MTILDRLLGHDAWTTRQLLLRCVALPDEDLNRFYDIGNRSLIGTFDHIVSTMETHMDLMVGRLTEEHYNKTRPFRGDVSIFGMLKRLSVIAQELSVFAARVVREGREDDMVINPNNGNRRSLGGVIAHLITHSMHHRAQILYILDQIGVPNVLEGDLLGWESQARGWGWNEGGSYGSIMPG